MWRLSINVEFGKDDPPKDEREGSADALVSDGPPPHVRPIGFMPPGDPVRRGWEDKL